MAKKIKKNDIVYCAFCGEANKFEDKICKKCKKDLHPKNSLFKDFLYDHIKDDLKSKVEDSIFSYLKNYIISHLYGTLMTVSIIFTTVAIIISPNSSYKTISNIDEINKTKTNTKGIVATIYTYDDTCDEDFPEELLDVPFPVAGGLISGRKKTAIEIALKKGMSINDWCSSGHEEDIICEYPVYVYDSKIDELAKTYHDKLYDYADWYHKNGISNDSEYARRTSELDDLSYELMYSDSLVEYDKSKPVNKSVDLFISEVGCEY